MTATTPPSPPPASRPPCCGMIRTTWRIVTPSLSLAVLLTATTCVPAPSPSSPRSCRRWRSSRLPAGLWYGAPKGFWSSADGARRNQKRDSPPTTGRWHPTPKEPPLVHRLGDSQYARKNHDGNVGFFLACPGDGLQFQQSQHA